MSVIKLEIYSEWWTWSGCRTDYYHCTDWTWCKDPIDGDQFDALSAFPTVKPNFDVLRPPRRSRKQRGWYQLKPWSHDLIPHTQVKAEERASRSSRYVTGADLPQELFQRIIDKVALDDRRALSVCGQVCRYWAEKCRPLLFRSLTLRSREDILEFREFDRDPACRFFRYVEEITLPQHVLSEPPWIHIFTQTGYKVDFPLSLKGPLRPGWKTMRSIHQALPRSLPRSYSSGISSITLADIPFLRLHDLMHLVSELPHLTELECVRITWGADMPTRFPRRRAAGKRGSMELPSGRFPPSYVSGPLTVRMKDSGQTWARASISLLSCFEVYKGPLFSSADLPGIFTVAELFEALAASVAEDTVHEVRLHREGTSDDGMILADFSIFCTPSNAYVFRVSVAASTKQAAQGADGDERVFHVSIVLLHPKKHNGEWPGLDWGSLDKVVGTGFSFLELVSVQLDSKDNKLNFIEDIADKRMPFLSARGLEYNVWD